MSSFKVSKARKSVSRVFEGACRNCVELGHLQCTETVPCLNSIFRNMLPVHNHGPQPDISYRTEMENDIRENEAGLDNGISHHLDIPPTPNGDGQGIVPRETSIASSSPTIQHSPNSYSSVVAIDLTRDTSADANDSFDGSHTAAATSPLVNEQPTVVRMIDVCRPLSESDLSEAHRARTWVVAGDGHSRAPAKLEGGFNDQSYASPTTNSTATTPGNEYHSSGWTSTQHASPASTATTATLAGDSQHSIPMFQSQSAWTTGNSTTASSHHHAASNLASHPDEPSTGIEMDGLELSALDQTPMQAPAQSSDQSHNHAQHTPTTPMMNSPVPIPSLVVGPSLAIGLAQGESIRIKIRIIIEFVSEEKITLIHEPNPNFDNSQPGKAYRATLMTFPSVVLNRTPFHICQSQLRQMGEDPKIPDRNLDAIQAYCTIMCSGDAAWLLSRRPIASFSCRFDDTPLVHLAHCYVARTFSSRPAPGYLLRSIEEARDEIHCSDATVGYRAMARARDTFFLNVYENLLRQRPTASERHVSLAAWSLAQLGVQDCIVS